ncbi:hypothetical protein RI129_000600 [Pyrocoelia pectoralis]|uniref:15-hydroxyprostaglandin dehydrogenase [NAD(+)]-like n=1 Tax=Pyrocoelia pectoralis TaxID=417401 RepID=A0AAN7VRS6_9COLE
MFSVCGKVAIVTGGAQGIGLAIVKELLQNDAKGIAIFDIKADLGERVVEEINDKFGAGKVIFLNVDVRHRNEVECAMKKAVAHFKHLDIVVNNAGIFNDNEWEKSIEVNLTGTCNGTALAFKHYLPSYKSGNEGVILNIAAISAVQPIFLYYPIYSATKSGVVALTRSLGHSAHYERNNVRIMALCPHYTTTEMTPPKENRYMIPEFFNFQTQLSLESPSVWQEPEHVAKAAVEIMGKGKNGSVWISEYSNAPYEIEMYFSKK